MKSSPCQCQNKGLLLVFFSGGMLRSPAAGPVRTLRTGPDLRATTHDLPSSSLQHPHGSGGHGAWPPEAWAVGASLHHHGPRSVTQTRHIVDDPDTDEDCCHRCHRQQIVPIVTLSTGAWQNCHSNLAFDPAQTRSQEVSKDLELATSGMDTN